MRRLDQDVLMLLKSRYVGVEVNWRGMQRMIVKDVEYKVENDGLGRLYFCL